MAEKEEPVVGIPFYIGTNPYQSGAIPPNAIFGNPMGAPIQQTIYRDTPAPFNCVYCGNSGVTEVRQRSFIGGECICSVPGWATCIVNLALAILSFFPPFLWTEMYAKPRSKPSLAAVVGCMMPMMLGICFLCPSMDCLWHKYHHCPACKEKVANFEKSDPCVVMDPPHWTQLSFAVPA